MIEYLIEPCNSLKREPMFFGIPQQLFFLWVSSALFYYIIYTVASSFNIGYYKGIILAILIFIGVVSLFYLKKKGGTLNISEIQKKFVYSSRPHWIKAK